MGLESDFRLHEWTIKLHTNTMEGPSGEAHIEPKAMQVLAFLAERPGEVFSKQDILGEVWRDTFVSDEVLTNAIWELRRALGDDAKRPRFIQTLPKKGYRLIAPVEPVTDSPTGSFEEAERPAPWFRRSSTWLVGAGALTILTLFVALHRNGAESEASSSSGPYPILVLGFENHTDSQELAWLAGGVPTMLRTGLAEVPGLTVVSHQRVDQLLREIDGKASDRELASRTGARAVLRGSVFQQGDEYRIDVQVEDVDSASIMVAHSVRGDDVFALMDELTLRVRNALNDEALIPSSPIPHIAEITTKSLEAYRLYNEGVTARRNLRMGDARLLLSRAVEIDPEFALAYYELRTVAMIGRDDASYDEYHKKLLEHQSRLPPAKRVLLEAVELWDADRERAEAMLLDLIEQFPEEEEAYMHLYHLYDRGGQLDEARSILERGTTALPHSGYLHHMLGYVLLRASRFSEAIHEFESYAEIYPREANPRDSIAEVYLVAGIPSRALEEYAQALEIDSTFSSANVGRSWAFAQMGRFDDALVELDRIQGDLPPGYTPVHLLLMRAYLLSRVGRFSETDALLDEMMAMAQSSESPVPAVATNLFCALVAIEREDLQMGLVSAETALARFDGDTKGNRVLELMAHLLAGIGAARSGDLDAAQEHLGELEARYEPSDSVQNWWYHLLRGETLLARGEAKAALGAFTTGEPRQKMHFSVTKLLTNLGGGLSFRDGRARALALSGESAAAIDAYEKLLRPDIGQPFVAVLEPRYHIQLARLYGESGRYEKAVEHYRRFIQLWSKADPDDSELAEARTFVSAATDAS